MKVLPLILILAVMLLSAPLVMGAITIDSPADGATINHAGASQLINATSDSLGTVTYTWTYQLGSGDVKTIVSGDADGAFQWDISGDIIGSVFLSATGDNGSVTDTNNVTVSISSYSSGDIPSVVIDFLGSYGVIFVTFGSVIALFGVFLYFRSRIKGSIF